LERDVFRPLRPIGLLDKRSLARWLSSGFFRLDNPEGTKDTTLIFVMVLANALIGYK
jgi:hypothetical protein